MQAGEINIKFKVDSAGAITGIQQVSGAVEKSTESISGLNTSMVNAAAGLTVFKEGLGLVRQGLDELVVKPGQMAQGLKDLSYQTGVSTTQLQKLQYAAVISGTEFGSVSTALNKLTLSMGEAQKAGSGAADAFAKLGISPIGKSTEEVFEETTRALVSMKDETERNAIAMELYGLRWKQMLPFMESYIKNSKEIREHPTLSDKDLETLEKAKVSWDKVTDSATLYFYKSIAGLDNLNTKLVEQHDALMGWLDLYRAYLSGNLENYLKNGGKGIPEGGVGAGMAGEGKGKTTAAGMQSWTAEEITKFNADAAARSAAANAAIHGNVWSSYNPVTGITSKYASGSARPTSSYMAIGTGDSWYGGGGYPDPNIEYQAGYTMMNPITGITGGRIAGTPETIANRLIGHPEVELDTDGTLIVWDPRAGHFVNYIAAQLEFGRGSLKNPDGSLRTMAAGGIVTRPTMALIGEAGPEAVIPLSSPGGMPIHVTVEIDGEAVASAVARSVNRQIGSRL